MNGVVPFNILSKELHKLFRELYVEINQTRFFNQIERKALRLKKTRGILFETKEEQSVFIKYYIL